MQIRISGHNKSPNFEVSVKSVWYEFHRVFIDHGFSITNGPLYSSQIYALIANSHSRELIKEADFYRIPLSRRILILWEPPATIPRTYRQKILKMYGKVFFPSEALGEEYGGDFFHWPQNVITRPIQLINEWQNRRNKLVAIFGNKFSTQDSELYSFRRQFLHEFEDLFPKSIDLYGTEWNQSRIKNIMEVCKKILKNGFLVHKNINLFKYLGNINNYCGKCEDKLDTYRQYKYALVIENSTQYSSEKYFDAVAGGCIVLYVGLRLQNLKFKNYDLIQCDPSSLDILKKYLKIIKMGEIEQYNLMKDQYESAQDWSKINSHHQVLNKLANSILQII